MSNELYLILHRVRGEPAFDIASKLENVTDPVWIIPTSGHRAYPYRWWNLEDLADISDINMSGLHDRPASFDHTVPADWPDHYQAEYHKLNVKAKVYRALEKNDPSDTEMLEVLDLLQEYSK